MPKKYYAVRAGKKTGIFLTWEECKKQVDGFSGAEYKSFKTREEALSFLEENKRKATAALRKSGEGDRAEAKDRVIAYVDGSYSPETKEFSYGMVIIRDGKEYPFSEKVEDKELALMHNVAGEIKGSEAAMTYAMENGLKSITIYHDYEGIAKWCTGAWKANKPGTQAYRDFYRKASEKVEIDFVKVKGHSNDKYNDMVDRLAKEALGIME